VTATRIFLVTDYGLDDEFVGVLHAVIARLAPAAQVIDVSHGVRAFDVVAGASLLARAAPQLGPGVICAVVDPGVGSSRLGVAIEADESHVLVGPNNGLLLEAAGVLGGVRRAVALTSLRGEGAPRAATFDGRDLFAPAAARLAAGAPLESLGEPVSTDSLVVLEPAVTTARQLPDGRVALIATVRWIDRFGNVQLSVPGHVLEGATTAGVVVRDEDALVRVVATFSDLDPGNAGVLRDAIDAVTLVVSQGSAAARFDLAVGDRVELVGSFGPLR
jgi:S-adenosylmethionine hydrolase